MSTEKIIRTVNQRQADLRNRRVAAGFRQLNEWIHDEDREILAQYAKALRIRRWKIIIRERGGE